MKGEFFACLEGNNWKSLQILIEKLQKSSKVSMFFPIVYYFGPKRAKLKPSILKIVVKGPIYLSEKAKIWEIRQIISEKFSKILKEFERISSLLYFKENALNLIHCQGRTDGGKGKIRQIQK